MARGYLSGAIWGTVLSVAGLGTLSVLSPTLTDPQPGITGAAMPTTEAPAQKDAEAASGESAAPSVPSTGSEPEPQPAETGGSDIAGEEPAAEPVPQPVTQPGTASETAPAPETQPVTEPVSQPGRRPADVTAVNPETGAPGLATPGAGADTAPDNSAMVPTPLPETGTGVAELTAPEERDTSGVSVEAGGPAPQPASPAPALSAPQGELGLAVSTEPAQPPAPAVPDVQTALAPDPAPEVVEPAVIPEPEGTSDPEVAQPDAEAAPQKPAVRRLVPDTPAPDASQSTDTAALARPAIGKPASSLVDRPGEANTSRLPSIGDSTGTAESGATAGDDTVPPLKRYAAPAEADATLPRMAIVLIDDMTGPLGPDTLDTFPFAVTFALDPAKPGAAERMAAYRSKGFEVATLTRLPDAATPSDVEQLLAGAVAALPESVALIEAPGSALQSSRTSTEQLARFAAESGHGLVFLPNGLNTAEAMARRENIAAVSVLRDFDGEAQDARTKRRFLDGGAFRARQDGAVVMLGRLTPDTLSALVLWSLQDRASSVAMVPVSNILIDSLQ